MRFSCSIELLSPRSMLTGWMCQAENRLSETAPLRWQHRAPRNYTQVFTHLDGPKALIRTCRVTNCTFTLPKKKERARLSPRTCSAVGRSRLITASFISRRTLRETHSLAVLFLCLQSKACNLSVSDTRCNTSFGSWKYSCLDDT